MDYEVLSEEHNIKKEGELYTVGSNLLPEFDDNILGMKPDEERKFPTLISGKRTEINIKLHMGVKTLPAILDDELAKKVGQESLAKLRENVFGAATAKLKQYEEAMTAEQIKKRLIQGHDFEVPSWLVGMEAQHIALNEGIKWEEITDEAKAVYESRARDSVKLSLILDSIRLAEPETQLSDSEIAKYLEYRIASQGKDPAKVLAEAEKNGSLIGIVAAMRNEYAIHWLVEHSKVVE